MYIYRNTYMYIDMYIHTNIQHFLTYIHYNCFYYVRNHQVSFRLRDRRFRVGI